MNNIANHLNVLTLNVGYAHHEADWNEQTDFEQFASSSRLHGVHIQHLMLIHSSGLQCYSFQLYYI